MYHPSKVDYADPYTRKLGPDINFCNLAKAGFSPASRMTFTPEELGICPLFGSEMGKGGMRNSVSEQQGAGNGRDFQARLK